MELGADQGAAQDLEDQELGWLLVLLVPPPAADPPLRPGDCLQLRPPPRARGSAASPAVLVRGDGCGPWSRTWLDAPLASAGLEMLGQSGVSTVVVGVHSVPQLSNHPLMQHDLQMH